MKEVLQKLLFGKARLEDAWAATRVDQPDTMILRHAGDCDEYDTLPMHLMEVPAHH
jgi:hypothetical protein